jgi:hypothetical protein
MPTGYRIADGRDLSELFEPGNAGIVTGYRDPAGVDLGSLFLPIASGRPLGFGTFFRELNAGQDLAELFAALGSAKTVWLAGNLKVGRDVSGQIYGYATSGITNPAGVWTETVNGTTPQRKSVSNISYGISTQASNFTTSPGGILVPGLFDARFEWRINGVDYTAVGAINTSGTYVISTPQAFSSFQVAYANSETFLFEVTGDPVVVQPGELYPMDMSGGNIGYSPPYRGLINPTTINGQSIYYLYNSASAGLTIALTGNPAQNHFNSLVLNGTTFTTASATFYPYYDDGEGGGNAATWIWPGGYAFTPNVTIPWGFT